MKQTVVTGAILGLSSSAIAIMASGDYSILSYLPFTDPNGQHPSFYDLFFLVMTGVYLYFCKMHNLSVIATIKTLFQNHFASSAVFFCTETVILLIAFVSGFVAAQMFQDLIVSKIMSLNQTITKLLVVGLFYATLFAVAKCYVGANSNFGIGGGKYPQI